MKQRLFRLISVFAWATSSAWVFSQTYSIDWFTLHGVGGTGRGGTFTVSSTVGQPDAGRLEGGKYTLDGGFWPGVTVVPTGATPTLFIYEASGIVTISWSPEPSGFVLEQSDELSPPTWIPAPPGNPVSTPTGTGAQFYRLRRP